MNAEDPLEGATLLGAEVAVVTRPPEVEPPAVELAEPGYRLTASRDVAVLVIDGVGTLCAERGERVSVIPGAGVDPGLLRAYLRSTVSALLLAQRGQFALHANAVGVGGRAVLIAGSRGVGKSTTAIRLIQRGHDHLADDMCVLAPEGPRMWLEPTARGLRVAPASADALGLDVSGAELPFPDSEKVVLPLEGAGRAPAAGVVVLETGAVDAPGVVRVQGRAAAALLLEHAYRADLLRPVVPGEIFEWATACAQRLPVIQITRPATTWTVDAVAEAIEAWAASLPAQ